MSNPQKHQSDRRLPPLHLCNSSKSSHHTTNKKPKPMTQNSNKYVNREQANFAKAVKQGPFRTPLPNFGQRYFKSTPTKNNKIDPSTFLKDLNTLDPEIILLFLKEHPSLVQRFIKGYVTIDKLDHWLNLKVLEKQQQHCSITGELPTTIWNNATCVNRVTFMETFVNKVHNLQGDVRGDMLYEAAQCCATAINVSDFQIYLMDEKEKVIWKYNHEALQPCNMKPIHECTTVSNHVALKGETVLCNCVKTDTRFPQGTGSQDVGRVLCSPVFQYSGEMIGIIELTRPETALQFVEKDNVILNGYLTWGGIVLHYAETYHSMHKQRKLNEFLLTVTKSIFQDIVSMDTVIMKIMNFAQTLVDADRTSLFLIDNATCELYARIFDIGTGADTKLKQEIRFPKSKGVAGHVATTGETLNIKNAYDDARFNRDVDHITGYTTTTLLCMPIFIRGNIIGVVQMVNKKQGVFTDADEKAFQTFAVYCGLALHNAKLYDKIRRSEQKYKVALEVLSYHSMCNESEIQAVRNCKREIPIEKISRYELNPFDIEQSEMASISIEMFHDLFKSDNRFDFDELTRFTLTVRKNYRRVPYHNWTHAFSVAHCMYCVVKSSQKTLNGLEAVALYVACLCHDLDHRGKNNEWMKVESTPLAAVYTTSTLEHHHFNQTITILQHEGHNIFSQLNSQEYKKVLGMVRDCILATDLAQFFGNKAKLHEIVKENKFDWSNEDHRAMFRALAMTCCDLSACAKPWKAQYETVKVIFQEFYAQGDEEKALGRTPVPMMDRDTADKLPNHQVGFLVGICVPGYDLLTRLVPDTAPLVEGAKKNLSIWSEMVRKQNEEKDLEKAAEKITVEESS